MTKIVIDARESGTSTGRYIDKLVEHLNTLKPKYNITIITTPERLDYVQQIAPRFEVVGTTYKEFGFAEQFGFLKQIRNLKPDLVHFGMTQQPVLYRGKTVTTIHDLTTTRFRNPSKNWLVFTFKQLIYKIVTRIVANKSAKIITPTEFVKEDVAKFAEINSRKITVTYEAADAITDNAEPLEELGDKRFIMYVGRPQPHKNLDRLIEAFGLLRQTHPELRLVLAGKKDSLYKKIEKQTTVKGIKNVVFTDFVTEGQLRWLYENTSAYVFPSLSEGFGLPALEAMKHGAPVVSSNATCLPEVYGDAALYFDPTKIEEIAEVIGKVLDSPIVAKDLSGKGLKQSDKYSWQKMAEQTLSVYDEVLEN